MEDDYDEDEDLYEDEDEEEDEPEHEAPPRREEPPRRAEPPRRRETPTYQEPPRRNPGGGKVVNIHATTQLQVVLVKPERYENASEGTSARPRTPRRPPAPARWLKTG